MWEPNKLRNPCGGKLYPQFYRVEYVFVESRCQSKRRQIVTTLSWRQLVLSKRRWGKQSIRLKLEALIKLIAGGGCQYAHSRAKLGSHMVLWSFAALHLLFTTQERRYSRDGHDPKSQVLSLYPGSLCTVAQHVDATCTYLMTQIPVWYAMFSTDADNISQAGQAVCLPWLTMLACIYMSSVLDSHPKFVLVVPDHQTMDSTNPMQCLYASSPLYRGINMPS